MRFLNGVESGGWEIVDAVQGRCCKKGLRTARSTATRAADRKLRRESRRGKITELCCKNRVKQSEQQEPVRQFYYGRLDNLRWRVGQGD
jgi:hypothetical protein